MSNRALKIFVSLGLIAILISSAIWITAVRSTSIECAPLERITVCDSCSYALDADIEVGDGHLLKIKNPRNVSASSAKAGDMIIVSDQKWLRDDIFLLSGQISHGTEASHWSGVLPCRVSAYQKQADGSFTRLFSHTVAFIRID